MSFLVAAAFTVTTAEYSYYVDDEPRKYAEKHSEQHYVAKCHSAGLRRTVMRMMTAVVGRLSAFVFVIVYAHTDRSFRNGYAVFEV